MTMLAENVYKRKYGVDTSTEHAKKPKQTQTSKQLNIPDSAATQQYGRVKEKQYADFQQQLQFCATCFTGPEAPWSVRSLDAMDRSLKQAYNEHKDVTEAEEVYIDFLYDNGKRLHGLIMAQDDARAHELQKFRSKAEARIKEIQADSRKEHPGEFDRLKHQVTDLQRRIATTMETDVEALNIAYHFCPVAKRIELQLEAVDDIDQAMVYEFKTASSDVSADSLFPSRQSGPERETRAWILQVHPMIMAELVNAKKLDEFFEYVRQDAYLPVPRLLELHDHALKSKTVEWNDLSAQLDRSMNERIRVRIDYQRSVQGPLQESQAEFDSLACQTVKANAVRINELSCTIAGLQQKVQNQAPRMQTLAEEIANIEEQRKKVRNDLAIAAKLFSQT